MSSKTEIKCLKALDGKVDCFNDMIDFLSKEKVIDLRTKHKLSIELKLELPYELHKILNKALREETLQLVDYSWVMLPDETITVTIITMHSRKDFTWNRK